MFLSLAREDDRMLFWPHLGSHDQVQAPRLVWPTVGFETTFRSKPVSQGLRARDNMDMVVLLVAQALRGMGLERDGLSTKQHWEVPNSQLKEPAKWKSNHQSHQSSQGFWFGCGIVSANGHIQTKPSQRPNPPKPILRSPSPSPPT